VGARSGDVLLAIDGQRLGAGDARRARQLLRDGFDHRLTLVRLGRPFDVVLKAASGVRPVGTRRFEITRRLLQRMLEHPTDLMTGAQLAPWNAPDGPKGVGLPKTAYRLDRLETEAPLAYLGLRAGDVILRANGESLAHPESCLTAYARVRDSSYIDIRILRDGQPARLEYFVR
jgi:type II secretory pathway component PulC